VSDRPEARILLFSADVLLADQLVIDRRNRGDSHVSSLDSRGRWASSDLGAL